MSYYVKHTHTWEKDKTNIAHFFHEYLFYALDAYIMNNTITFILDTKLSEWELKFCLLICKHLNIKLEYDDLYYDPHNGGGSYNIKENKNFIPIMNLIKNIISKEYNINYNGNYKVLYFRDECPRRKMIHYNGEINHMFDEIITDMTILTFDEQVKLFMKCSCLVTTEGAHLTNILFMNNDAKIFNISTKDNCWTLMFGLYKCINENNFTMILIDSQDFNSNIIYTKDIEDNILLFLKNNTI
jgi:hypothetical protein